MRIWSTYSITFWNYKTYDYQSLSCLRCLLCLLPGLLLLGWIESGAARGGTDWNDWQTQWLQIGYERQQRPKTKMSCPHGIYRQKGTLQHLCAASFRLPRFPCLLGVRHPQWTMRQSQNRLGVASINTRNLASAWRLPQGGIILTTALPPKKKVVPCCTPPFLTAKPMLINDRVIPFSPPCISL